MRILSIVTAITFFLVSSALPAIAQDSTKDLAVRASAELRLLTAFRTLERMTSQMNHFIVYGLLAERGGWRVVEKDVGNAYIIQATAESAEVEVARAYSSIKKSKVATEDEKKNAESAVENLNVLIALAPELAALIEAGNLDAAAGLYRETGHSAHEAAFRGAQSSVGTVHKRLGKTLLEMRFSE